MSLEASFLQCLGKYLGDLMEASIPRQDGNLAVDGRYVNRIQALDEPLRNERGRLVVSTSFEKFLCHTDEYSEESPADFIILQCVKPDPDDGGKTLLANVDDIVTRLSRETGEILADSRFPHRLRYLLDSANHQNWSANPL